MNLVGWWFEMETPADLSRDNPSLAWLPGIKQTPEVQTPKIMDAADFLTPADMQ